jgi:uroporphyrinogen-III synthase
MADATQLLLTRPLAQAQDWSERLAALGVPTMAFPLIDIVPSDDAAPARDAWADVARLALVMFVSPNAVRHFFDHRPPGQGWPENVLAATVGPGSAQALEAAGVPSACIVQPPRDADSLDSEHLWPELQRVAGSDWTGRSALMVRGDGGREWLGDRLKEAGASVEAISVYRRQCPVLDVQGRERLKTVLTQPDRYVWLFSSSEAVGYLASMLGDVEARAGARASPESGTDGGRLASPGLPAEGFGPVDWGAVRAVATHERIAARARALGLIHVVLVRPDAVAVAEAFRRLSGSPLESAT